MMYKASEGGTLDFDDGDDQRIFGVWNFWLQDFFGRKIWQVFFWVAGFN